MGPQTFTAENAAQEQAKWPLNAGCLVCLESIINVALLVISTLSHREKINEGCVLGNEVRLQLTNLGALANIPAQVSFEMFVKDSHNMFSSWPTIVNDSGSLISTTF